VSEPASTLAHDQGRTPCACHSSGSPGKGSKPRFHEVIGLSLPEAIILRKVLKLKLTAVFFGVVGLGILLVGCLFNAVM
jgi:hypothetical protein